MASQIKVICVILLHYTPLSCLGNVIGDNYGLARKATAIAVRVLNDNGSGSFAYVIQ